MSVEEGSYEDWELLENFFHKMHANKMEQIEKEYYEDLAEGYGKFPDIENASANEK